MKPRLLVTRRAFDEVLARLAPSFELETNQDDAVWSVEDLSARAADKDALYVANATLSDIQKLFALLNTLTAPAIQGVGVAATLN